MDLKQVVPSGLLGIKEKPVKGDGAEAAEVTTQEKEAQKQDEEDIKRQLEQLSLQNGEAVDNQDKETPLVRIASHESNVSSATEVDEPEPSLSTQPTDDDGLQSGPAARLTALFAALPEANNREVVDKLAVEFAFLNSKAARNRLVKFIGAVPKNRTDLLPHYARLVATLERYMPDVGTGIIELVSIYLV